MFTQNFIKIFYSVQEIGLFSLFQNLALGKASTNDICHFAISCTRCRQYQCVCKILSKYPKRFKSYWHFSRTDRWQNLHKQAGDKIKWLIVGHTMKVNRQFQLSFLGSCNSQSYLMRFRLNPTGGALEDFWNAQQQVHTMLPIAALAFITGIGHVASTTDEGVFASSITESTGSPSVSGKHNGAGWLYSLELVD